MVRPLPNFVLLALLASWLASCASAPLPGVDQDPRLDRFRALGTVSELRLAVGQAGVPADPQTELDPEAPDRWRMALEPAALSDGLAGLLSKDLPLAARTQEVRRPPAQRARALEEAWAGGNDLLLELDVSDAQVRYDGHNGWYFPNLIPWLYLWFPAIFVADEVYAYESTGTVRLMASGTDQVILERPFHVAGKRTLSDLDRGVKFYTLSSVPKNFGAENWRRVAEALRPSLERDVQVEVLRGLEEGLADAGQDPRMSAVLALCVGVGRHAKAGVTPFDAARDARAFAAFLGLDPWIPQRNVTTLLDGQATRTEMLAALDAQTLAARPRDQVVVFFSGVGALTGGQSGGQAALLPYDFDPADPAGTGLGLDALASRLLSSKAGRILVVIDAAFGPYACPRALPGGASTAGDPYAAFAADPRITVLAATASGGEAWNDPPGGSGLFTHYLLAGLQRDVLGSAAADARGDGDGKVSAAELAAFLKREMRGQAMLADPNAGRDQVPFLLEGTAAGQALPGGEKH